MTRPRDKLPVTRHTLAPSRNITRWPELELELPREKCEQRVDTDTAENRCGVEAGAETRMTMVTRRKWRLQVGS